LPNKVSIWEGPDADDRKMGAWAPGSYRQRIESARRIGPQLELSGCREASAGSQRHRHVFEVHVPAFGQADSTRNIGRRAHDEHHPIDVAGDGNASGDISLRTTGINMSRDGVVARRDLDIESIIRR
jgi:hypothetical protein